MLYGLYSCILLETNNIRVFCEKSKHFEQKLRFFRQNCTKIAKLRKKYFSANTKITAKIGLEPTIMLSTLGA